MSKIIIESSDNPIIEIHSEEVDIGIEGIQGNPALLLDQFAHFTVGVKVTSGLAADCLTFANTDENKLLMQLPSDDAYVNFNLAQGLHANPTGTRKNPTIHFGFNTLDGGAQEVAGEAQVFDSWEHHFAAEEGKTLLERHWIFGPAAGGTQYRPISSSMQLENDWVDISFCADKMSFFAKDASNQYLVLQAVGSIIINNKDLYHNLDNHYAYYVNQATPGYEIQHTYAVEGVNKWVQRITGTANDFVIYDPTTYGKVVQIIKSSGYVGIGRNEESVDAQLHVGGAGKFEAGVDINGSLLVGQNALVTQNGIVDAFSGIIMMGYDDGYGKGALFYQTRQDGKGAPFTVFGAYAWETNYAGYTDEPLRSVWFGGSHWQNVTAFTGGPDANDLMFWTDDGLHETSSDTCLNFRILHDKLWIGKANNTGIGLPYMGTYSRPRYKLDIGDGDVRIRGTHKLGFGGDENNDYAAYMNYDANILGFSTDGTMRLAVSASGAEVIGDLQCDSLRIDQAATVGGLSPDSYFTLSLNGTSYKVPCIAA